MTIQELYKKIGGDYDQAISALRLDKLADKHIRKFTKNGVVEGMIAAGEDMDPAELFEAAHAMKGVCANLGLLNLARMASEIAEDYRPGTGRKLSDDGIKERIAAIREIYGRVAEGIREYEESQA